MGSFNELMEAEDAGELIQKDGGTCLYHLRRDGQLTIHILLVARGRRGQGVGSAILAELESVPGAVFLLARCPANLPSNAWYARKGFVLKGKETTPSGKELNVWTKPVTGQGPHPKQLELGEDTRQDVSPYSLSDLDNHWSHED